VRYVEGPFRYLGAATRPSDATNASSGGCPLRLIASRRGEPDARVDYRAAALNCPCADADQSNVSGLALPALCGGDKSSEQRPESIFYMLWPPVVPSIVPVKVRGDPDNPNSPVSVFKRPAIHPSQARLPPCLARCGQVAGTVSELGTWHPVNSRRCKPIHPDRIQCG